MSLAGHPFFLIFALMEFSLITMGTASASANPRRHTSAHVVTVHNHRFLVDCGEGCQMSLQQCKVAFSWIDNILISHLHGDHLFGIFGLLSTMAMQGRTAPLYGKGQHLRPDKERDGEAAYLAGPALPITIVTLNLFPGKKKPPVSRRLYIC